MSSTCHTAAVLKRLSPCSWRTGKSISWSTTLNTEINSSWSVSGGEGGFCRGKPTIHDKFRIFFSALAVESSICTQEYGLVFSMLTFAHIAHLYFLFVIILTILLPLFLILPNVPFFTLSQCTCLPFFSYTFSRFVQYLHLTKMSFLLSLNCH